MVKNIFKHYIYPIATLSGSIIGVGFLALPYITLQVGVLPMLAYFFILTLFVVCIHIMFGRISLATPDFKRWPGFVGYYFGPWAKRFIMVPMIVGLVGILLIYLIVGSQFLSALLSPFIGGTGLFYALTYFVAASSLIFFGIKAVSRFEFWALLIFLFSLGMLFFKGVSFIHMENFSFAPFAFHLDNFFLPYAAIVFSLWGTGLIPEVEEMLRGNKRSFNTVIILGTLIPAALYFLFVVLVLGISGGQTTESALIGLKQFLGNSIVSVALLVGIITTFNAFISQGLLLKKVFIYDMGANEFSGWVLACLPPLILFLLGAHSFIPLLSFIGGALLSIDGILILLMYRKIGGSKFLVYPLMVFFVLAVAYQLYSLYHL